jgi:FixJ family two-component response regulator
MLNTRPFVFVVDDDISVRESLEMLIKRSGWQPELFPSALEFLARKRDFAPSCLVLDVSLPGLDGLGLQKRVAVERPDMPIIFITGCGDIPMSIEAMKAGAVEFLTKPFSDSTLIEAIGKALARSRTALWHEAELRQLREGYEVLTHRERQVMSLVVTGMLNKEVGAELGISEITVKAHRGKVMRKMKADTLAALIKMATRLHLTRLVEPKINPLASFNHSENCVTSEHNPTIGSRMECSGRIYEKTTADRSMSTAWMDKP